jgi:hypothetical protein
MKKILILILVFSIYGCATSSVVVGTVRTPIEITKVKTYLKPPKKYEEIALLETSSKASWAVTSQGKMDVVIERLKIEAAKIGANGILLISAGDKLAGSIGNGVGTTTAAGNTAYSTGTVSSHAIFHKAGNAIAIFVEEE